MSDEQQKLTIDGKEYNLSDLSDEVKNQLIGLRAAEQEMARLQTRLAICQTARNAYANSVKEALGKMESQ